MTATVLVEGMIRQLDSEYQNLVECAKALREEFLGETKSFGTANYRVFTIRNEKTCLKIEWGKVLFNGKKRLPYPERIKLGSGFTQSVKFMGNMDNNHLRLFTKYEPQLYMLREVAHENREAKKALEKLLKAGKTHGI